MDMGMIMDTVTGTDTITVMDMMIILKEFSKKIMTTRTSLTTTMPHMIIITIKILMQKPMMIN